MKITTTLFSCLTILFTFTLCACTPKQDQQVDNRTTGATVHQDIDQAAFRQKMGDPNVVVLDVRTPAETAEGTIPGAITLDYRAPDFAQQLQQLDKDKTYMVYCQAGGRSAKACELMEQQGFKTTYNLLGGYGQWADE